MEEELQDHTYRPSRSICFVVEEPTLREIFASTFRDRVVHHLLYNFLEPIFEPKFIDQSYACRKNKGTHQSLKDLQKYLRKITQNNRQKVYFMHLDIKGFFMALKKDILFDLISKQVKNPEFLWLAKIIIFNDPLENFTIKGNLSLFDKIPAHKSLFQIPRNQGLPIGNLTSQFFANIYLNELDQFVKYFLKARYYMRYVDDFLILSCDKNQLRYYRNKIIFFLKQRLELELNLQKQIIQTNDKGIDWLGYIVKPYYVLVRRRTVKALKNKLLLFNQIDEPPLEIIQKMLAVVNSYFGYFKHADTFRLRKNLLESHFGSLKVYFEPKDSSFSSIKIKSEFLKRAKRARK